MTAIDTMNGGIDPLLPHYICNIISVIGLIRMRRGLPLVHLKAVIRTERAILLILVKIMV